MGLFLGDIIESMVQLLACNNGTSVSLMLALGFDFEIGMF